MQQAAETLPVCTPAQIGVGIDGSFDSLAKEVMPTEWQDTVQNAPQGDFVSG
jgi:hypothetical protein